VDAKLKEMKAPYTDDQFDERLKANHTTLDDLKHNLRRTLTINKLLNKEINSKITVTDSDVANYYNQHKAEFNFIETQYHLAQIQVTNMPSPQPGNLQNSKATNDAGSSLHETGARLVVQGNLTSGPMFGAIYAGYLVPHVSDGGSDGACWMGGTGASETCATIRSPMPSRTNGGNPHAAS